MSPNSPIGWVRLLSQLRLDGVGEHELTDSCFRAGKCECSLSNTESQSVLLEFFSISTMYKLLRQLASELDVGALEFLIMLRLLSDSDRFLIQESPIEIGETTGRTV